MVTTAGSVEWTVVNTEVEALQLEYRANSHARERYSGGWPDDPDRESPKSSGPLRRYGQAAGLIPFDEAVAAANAARRGLPRGRS